MKHKRLSILLTLVGLLALLMIGAAVMAQTSADFNLEWHVIGNGGGPSSSASYHHVNGTMGQGVTGSQTSADYAVNSGYWVNAPEITVYLPIVIKN